MARRTLAARSSFQLARPTPTPLALSTLTDRPRSTPAAGVLAVTRFKQTLTPIRYSHVRQ